MRDWQEEEHYRRVQEMYDQQHGGGFDDILEVFVYIIVAVVGLLLVAGFLDSTFGWGLTDWIWGLIYEWTGGALGSPND